MGEAEEQWLVETQQTLGKLISKPKMTEKYLKKPPFRFLHDIVMEVTKTTGFGQGLYTPEESDAASLADKQTKVDFLNKAISVVSFALGETCDVTANKIVAGLEAEKTNIWLQKLNVAASTCVGAKSDEAVARVLNGESAAAPKKDKKKKEEPAEAKPPAPADAGEAAPPADDEAKKEEDKKRRAEKKKREEEKKRRAEAEAAEAQAQQAAAAAAAEQEAADAEAAEQERRAKKDADRARKKEEEKRQRAEAEAAAQQAEADAMAQQRAEEEQRAAMMQQPDIDEGAFPSAPGSAAQPTRPGADLNAAAQYDQQAMMGQPGEEGGAPGEDLGASMVPQKAERPRTAGRKPPKVTSKVKTVQDEPGLSAGVAAPAIITDNAKDDDDEDMFEAPQKEQRQAMNLPTEDDGQHGKLVRDLLAEKKDAEEKERLKKEEEETREEVEGDKGIHMGKLKRKKKGDASSLNEIDIRKLNESIQQLCQAANPLGKSIDLVHQDIANMGKELDHWRQEYRESNEQYQKELKTTDELLQPLYTKIADLDDQIAEQKAKMRNSRSRISKHDIKIQSLLESVVMAK